jgi:glutathione S-transferase
MKLLYSATSPFVRKVMFVAIELGLADRIELLPCAAHPVNRDPRIVASNPLGKVPTLISDDGVAVYDSRVICEYLEAIAGSAFIFPATGPARWRALTEQSLADGILDAGLLVRYESAVRPETYRYDPWIAAQMDKIMASLGEIEKLAADFGDRLDIGTISVSCALGYLDFRYPQLVWRQSCPVAGAWFAAMGERRSMQQTFPGLPT